MITQLILYTQSDNNLTAEITERLQQLRFIGEPISFRGEPHFTAGEAFLDQLTFLGCSPTFSLDPNDEEGFCHVSLHYSEAAQFLGGGPHTMVRCPACGQTIRQAADQVDHATLLWHCQQCGEERPAAEIRWRKQAGTGNLWLAVWGVQPELAVPNAKLVEQLEEVTGSEWRLCYLG